tara:strand:+ start:4939 stop:5100 length:162 start_codon:yes stop_codon:yes gene_type:complete
MKRGLGIYATSFLVSISEIVVSSGLFCDGKGENEFVIDGNPDDGILGAICDSN